MKRAFTIGVDYGTSSVRALVVDCADGRELGTAVFDYPSGEQGVLVDAKDPHLARQNPADYVLGLERSVAAALAAAEAETGFSRQAVIGIGVDTTGSTPIPVDRENRPLALDPRWKANLAAHAWLWKDHTGADEAAAITRAAREHAPQYLAPIADFVPALLAGVSDPRRIERGVCAAGHKAMYSRTWGGLPSKEFLARLDPKLGLLRERLYDEAHTLDRPTGRLCTEWASRLRLPEGIPIAMGAFDAHLGAVGAGVTAGTLVKIIGTSTCDCAVLPGQAAPPDVPGICGIVPGSILPGYHGIEAGQSAVGDLLRWWVEVVCEGDAALHARLSAEAAQLRPGQSGLVALDWNNGNRTILVDPRLTGLILGQTLHTTRAEIYRALVEATAFGARAIVERLREHGVAVERVVCCGGIAEKNDVFMQIYADVLGSPMLVAGSAQTPALGSAVAAAVTAGEAAGGHASFEAAQTKMTRLAARRFDPDPAAACAYDTLYAIYRELHDSFGGVPGAKADLPTLMKRLLALRGQVSN